MVNGKKLTDLSELDLILRAGNTIVSEDGKQQACLAENTDEILTRAVLGPNAYTAWLPGGLTKRAYRVVPELGTGKPKGTIVRIRTLETAVAVLTSEVQDLRCAVARVAAKLSLMNLMEPKQHKAHKGHKGPCCKSAKLRAGDDVNIDWFNASGAESGEECEEPVGIAVPVLELQCSGPVAPKGKERGKAIWKKVRANGVQTRLTTPDDFCAAYGIAHHQLNTMLKKSGIKLPKGGPDRKFRPSRIRAQLRKYNFRNSGS